MTGDSKRPPRLASFEPRPAARSARSRGRRKEAGEAWDSAPGKRRKTGLDRPENEDLVDLNPPNSNLKMGCSPKIMGCNIPFQVAKNKAARTTGAISWVLRMDLKLLPNVRLLCWLRR